MQSWALQTWLGVNGAPVHFSTWTFSRVLQTVDVMSLYGRPLFLHNVPNQMSVLDYDLTVIKVIKP